MYFRQNWTALPREIKGDLRLSCRLGVRALLPGGLSPAQGFTDQRVWSYSWAAEGVSGGSDGEPGSTLSIQLDWILSQEESASMGAFCICPAATGKLLWDQIQQEHR